MKNLEAMVIPKKENTKKKKNKRSNGKKPMKPNVMKPSLIIGPAKIKD